MGEAIDPAMHDAVFAARAGEAEWRRIAAFRDRPRFLDGVRRHAGVMRPFFGRSPILNKVVVEAWRFQIIVLTLYLHETCDPADPRSGLTIANLQRLCASLDLASAGRVYAFVQLMRVAGFLEAAPAGPDARVSRLAPTPRFAAIVETWNANIFASIDAAAPEGGLVALARAQPDLGRRMRTSGAEGLLAGWDAFRPFPESALFAGCDGGFMLMEHVVGRAIQPDGRIVTGPVALDLTAQARGFGGSRTNLLRLLDRAHGMGLLAVPHRAGREVVFRSLTICASLGFLASFLGYFEMHACLASASGVEARDGSP